MSTHPYIPLYVDDFEAATAHLTPEEDGIYNRLIRLAWRTPGCSLPVEPAWLARKLRVTAADFDRIAKPVLEEFFTVQRGRYIQRRLKREYDDISRKKTARKVAGKKGGEAKALKTKENAPSKASDLLADTRAFPNPEPKPEPEKEDGEAIASLVASVDATALASLLAVIGDFAQAVTRKPGAKRIYPDAFEAAWKAYPHHEGRSSKPNSLKLWKKLPVDEQAALVNAIERFKPKVASVCGGKGAPDMAVWLGDGKHLNWMEPKGETGQSAKVWAGPADLRTNVVAAMGPDFALGYLDPCDWREEPAKAVIAPNTYTASRLRTDVGDIFDRFGVAIVAKAARAAA